MFLAQSKGAKAVVIIHTTNSKDTVWLDYKQTYAYAKQITIPCYTVRQEMGVKISQMLPSLVGIAKKDTSTVPIQTLQQQQTDSIINASIAQNRAKDSLNAAQLAQQGWVLAPNPADDDVTVLYNFSTPQNAILQVSNNVGDVINIQKRENIQSGTFTIDVSAYPTGIYNINLQHGRFYETKRLLVTH